MRTGGGGPALRLIPEGRQLQLGGRVHRKRYRSHGTVPASEAWKIGIRRVGWAADFLIGLAISVRA